MRVEETKVTECVEPDDMLEREVMKSPAGVSKGGAPASSGTTR